MYWLLYCRTAKNICSSDAELCWCGKTFMNSIIVFCVRGALVWANFGCVICIRLLIFCARVLVNFNSLSITTKFPFGYICESISSTYLMIFALNGRIFNIYGWSWCTSYISCKINKSECIYSTTLLGVGAEHIANNWYFLIVYLSGVCYFFSDYIFQSVQYKFYC